MLNVYKRAPFKDPEYLLGLIIKRTKMFYSDPVHLLTTSHSGRLDGAWVRRRNEFTGVMEWEMAAIYPNADNIKIPMKDWGLIRMGELVYMYCHHPEANPKLVRKTYREWPMLVEMKLPSG